MQVVFSLLKLHHAPVWYLAMAHLSVYPVILVSVVGGGLSLQPLLPHRVVFALHISCLRLLGGALKLSQVSVLILLHAQHDINVILYQKTFI